MPITLGPRSRTAFRRSISGIYLLLFPLPWLTRGGSLAGIVAFIAGAAVFLALPFLPGRLAVPIAVRALIYAFIGILLIPFHGYWGVFFISAAATCGAITNRRLGLTMLAVILCICASLTWLAYEDLIGCLITIIVAIGTFATMVLSMDLHQRNEALAAAQEEIRSLTLIAERERLARDLHDTLGQSLTIIALKSELAHRHLPHDTSKAQDELDEIGQRARNALAETRQVVSDMRVTSLRDELASGVVALNDAGISTETSGEPGLMPAYAEAVLAFALREALTNILRHANAATCHIAFRQRATAVFELMVRDQTGLHHDSNILLSFREGNGISGMRRRLAEIDGRLDLTPRPDGLTLIITLGDLS
ncbi:sensor histidine kinase [Asaia bogorensis]|uniref:Histidine kinase n=1 Tax=Asaia bogorensis NBRC 16594 TaxID=1231624 RepID=A0AAN4U1A9_9PROT|nr:histidine kinase [Asaia bogorensis]BAT20319.1 two component sensor histidine kinase [Asaia bogorensis NBRC 16594]GBQ79725.1 signal transduction histidine kinase [Asaia bogorensis NBRC 16594]GEL52259.1 histidine kinase [Asaia bogorensis NBRC 16594]